MSRPLLLDLFCAAGGAAVGYHRAGFDVIGVDVEPQPNYPFEFVQADAVDFLRTEEWRTWGRADGFAAVHASPPCHDHSQLAHLHDADGTGRLLRETLDLLPSTGLPWVCENVVGPTVTMNGWYFTLCGSMFGLRVRRHRRFGSSFLVMPPPCDHAGQGRPVGVYGHGGGRGSAAKGVKAKSSEYAEVMGMPWATPTEIAQAIPPAYTEWIGHRLIGQIEI